MQIMFYNIYAGGSLVNKNSLPTKSDCEGTNLACMTIATFYMPRCVAKFIVALAIDVC